MKLHFYALAVLVILMALVLSACGPSSQGKQAAMPTGGNSSAPDQSDQNVVVSSESPQSSASGGRPDLHGLEKVDWPESSEEITALFSRLPQDIAGLEQGEEFRSIRNFGPDRAVNRSPIQLSAQEVRSMPSTLKQDAATAEEVVEGWARPDALMGEAVYDLIRDAWLGVVTGVEVNASGKDGDYAWVRFTSNSVMNLPEVGRRHNTFYNQQVHGLLGVRSPGAGCTL